MRAGVMALVIVSATTVAALAKDPSPDNVKGLYLTTDFPALRIRAGEETTLPLTIYNYGLPPQRTAITIADTPADWKADIEGSGKPVSAAFVDYDGRASLNLKLTIPASAKPGARKGRAFTPHWGFPQRNEHRHRPGWHGLRRSW